MKTGAAMVVAAAAALIGCEKHGVTADYVVTAALPLPDGGTLDTEITGWYAQDAEGRHRLELNDGITIFDPIAGAVWTLRSDAEHAVRSEIARYDSAQYPTDEEMDMEVTNSRPLGLATVNGVDARGRIVTAEVSAAEKKHDFEMETWWSESIDLNLPVKRVQRSPLVGEIVHELRNIRRLEPGGNEGLFRPDPEWTVVAKPAS